MNRWLHRALKAASVVNDVARPVRPGVTVLAYHQVGGPRASEVNLSAVDFARQMEWLAGHADVVTLDAALRDLDHGKPEARARVVITFDDGTADFVDRAVPILADHAFPATLYLATSFVEEGLSFWDDGSVLSWNALADVLTTGLVDIGSHTHRHILMDRVDAAEAASDIDESIALIEEHLGRTPTHFAYPKALPPSSAVERIVRARFRSAALAGGRANRFGATDPWRLGRTPVQVSDAGWFFTRKARGGLGLEADLRDAVATRRSRGARR